MVGVRSRRRSWGWSFLAVGLLSLSACEFERANPATCTLWPATPHGPSVVSGSVYIRADLPVFVAPGEVFTIRILELGGRPSIATMTPGGGYLSITGPVSVEGSTWITQPGQELQLTATGAPGEFIEIAAPTGFGFFGDPIIGGARCDVNGDGWFRSIMIREPDEPTTTTTTTP